MAIIFKSSQSICSCSPALSDSEGITDGSVSEARGEVDRDVLVPLLKPGGEEDEKTEMWKAIVDRGVFKNDKFWMKDLLYFLT